MSLLSVNFDGYVKDKQSLQTTVTDYYKLFPPLCAFKRYLKNTLYIKCNVTQVVLHFTSQSNTPTGGVYFKINTPYGRLEPHTRLPHSVFINLRGNLNTLEDSNQILQ